MKEEYQWRFKLENTPAEEGDPRVTFFRGEIEQLLNIVELLHNNDVVRVNKFRFIGEESVHDLYKTPLEPSSKADTQQEEGT